MNSIQKISHKLLGRRSRNPRGHAEKARHPADWLSQMSDVARKLPPRRGSREI